MIDLKYWGRLHSTIASFTFYICYSSLLFFFICYIQVIVYAFALKLFSYVYVVSSRITKYFFLIVCNTAVHLFYFCWQCKCHLNLSLQRYILFIFSVTLYLSPSKEEEKADIIITMYFLYTFKASHCDYQVFITEWPSDLKNCFWALLFLSS